MNATVLARFLENLTHLFPDPQEILLIGISGGSDSMALLHLMTAHLPRARERLHVVHVNHGLRPEAARLDEALVREQCARLGLLCFLYRKPVAQIAKIQKKSLEEVGREARHQCFLDAAHACRAGAVVLAHHQDDQAETLLLNLIRGAAGRGLSALHEQRRFPHPQAPAHLRLVRPLLHFSKHDLEAYLSARHLVWRQDETNHDPMFTRNRIRWTLLPLLENQFTPGIKVVLARSAEALARDEALLATLTEEAWHRTVITRSEYRLEMDCVKLMTLHPSLLWRVLARAWEVLGIPRKSTSHLDHIQALAAGRAKAISLPGGWQASRSHDHLIFFRTPPARRKHPG